jgi:hypothetical protein
VILKYTGVYYALEKRFPGGMGELQPAHWGKRGCGTKGKFNEKKKKFESLRENWK